MSDKLILDLCGGTGAWSEPYKNAGYDVRLITLPEHDILEYIPPENVYGVLSAPPCTMFSLARTTAKTPRDIKGALAIVSNCIRIVFICKPKFWALENPMCLLRKYLGPPKITVQPYWFSDRHSKQTDLWGDFNVPKFSPIRLTEDELHRAKQNSRILPKHIGLTQADKRAITPQGFAKAFFEANQ